LKSTNKKELFKEPTSAKNELAKNELDILPRSEEAVFLRCVQEIIAFERELEQCKISLSQCSDFNLIDAFGMVD
jgi:hypothetical protein